MLAMLPLRRPGSQAGSEADVGAGLLGNVGVAVLADADARGGSPRKDDPSILVAVIPAGVIRGWGPRKMDGTTAAAAGGPRTVDGLTRPGAGSDGRTNADATAGGSCGTVTGMSSLSLLDVSTVMSSSICSATHSTKQ